MVQFILSVLIWDIPRGQQLSLSPCSAKPIAQPVHLHGKNYLNKSKTPNLVKLSKMTVFFLFFYSLHYYNYKILLCISRSSCDIIYLV